MALNKVCLIIFNEEGPNEERTKTVSEKKKDLKSRNEREHGEVLERKPRKILSENREPKEPSTK